MSAYAAILEMLLGEGCGGATVTCGIGGLGAYSVIQITSILRLSSDLLRGSHQRPAAAWRLCLKKVG